MPPAIATEPLKIEKPKLKKTFDFKMGADPEFSITMQNRRVHARNTMQQTLGGKKEFAEEDMGYRVGKCGNIGWDGAAETAEIRPTAADSPTGLVENIHGLFKPFCKYMNLFDLSTLSEHASVGGHIHFEMPGGEKWNESKKEQVHRRMASFYLPIMLEENPTNLALRIKQGYGSLSDVRPTQVLFHYPDGRNGYTYEFRSASAEWLTTPKIAECTLAYMGVIYNEILNHPRKFQNYSDIVYKTQKQGNALQLLALTQYSVITKVLLNQIKKYVRTFELYPNFKDEIEYIFNIRKVIKDKEKADYNIVNGWGLSAMTVPKKSDITSDKRLEAKAGEIDLDTAKNIINVSYNNDTKVDAFASTLQSRVAAFKWKLKKSYYLFGMRKGINDIIAIDATGNWIAGKSSIKTKKDLEEITKLFNKMTNKFRENSKFPDNKIMNFKTGEWKSTKEDAIIIGLPYGMRIKQQFKPFVELIWKIEKNATPIERFSGKDVDNLAEGDGEISRILTGKQAEPMVTFAQPDNRSGQMQRAAIEELAAEGPVAPMVDME